MSYDYDTLYSETPNALGEPTQAFVEFFAQSDLSGARVLDVGCGQGRDALFIARLGHHVVGVDLAPSGIADLEAAAAKEALSIIGVVADIMEYAPEGLFDVVLIDRTLHMILEDAPRNAVFARLLGHVAAGGYLLLADERSNLAGFRAEIAGSDAAWEVRKEAGGIVFWQRLS